MTIFALAAITDWLDGYLARSWGDVSAFGAFLDPVADKLMVAAALIMLVWLGRAESYLAMIIIGREIAISALREWMAQLGKSKSVAVAFIGKIKTVAQMTAIIALLLCQPVIPGINPRSGRPSWRCGSRRFLRCGACSTTCGWPRPICGNPASAADASEIPAN